MIDIQLSKNKSFRLDYEQEDGNVTSISNIVMLFEGDVYREINEPSRRLEAQLIDAVQDELNKL